MPNGSHERRGNLSFELLLVYLVQKNIMFTSMMVPKESVVTTASICTYKGRMSTIRRRAAVIEGSILWWEELPIHSQAVGSYWLLCWCWASEHLPHDDDIIHDLICIVDGDDGLERSEEEISDAEITFEHPMSSVDFGINPFINDEVHMPSLDAGLFLSSAADVPTTADAPNVAGAATAATLNVNGATAVATPNVDGAVPATAPNVADAATTAHDGVPRFPSGQMQQRQESVTWRW
jgi:hypothetical protein